MKYLKISNNGEIEVEAFSLIGASSKRGDSEKIGMFGSGNKYAIAYLLRNNYKIHINSGCEKIEFTTKLKEFRGNQFNVISINGNETSITTEMGHKWSLWQAIRELYSNALDEGICEFKQVSNIDDGITGITDIYVSIDYELEDLMMNFDEYFVRDREPIFECKYGRIYNKTGSKARVYRKGIKVMETDKTSLFDYDINELEITEDRVAKYQWNIAEKIWRMIFLSDVNYIHRKILNNINNENLIENNSGNYYAKSEELNTLWIHSLEGLQIFDKNMSGWLSDQERLKTTFLPSWLYTHLIDKIGNILKPKSLTSSSNGMIYEEVEINDVRANILTDAMDFFNDAKFRFDYKTKVVDFRRTDILGSIDKDNRLILIDIKAIDAGKDEVINTIIEEYIHLKYGVGDETRGFQTSVITELINYMKSKIITTKAIEVTSI